jgi:hypothetical protein
VLDAGGHHGSLGGSHRGTRDSRARHGGTGYGSASDRCPEQRGAHGGAFDRGAVPIGVGSTHGGARFALAEQPRRLTRRQPEDRRLDHHRREA